MQFIIHDIDTNMCIIYVNLYWILLIYDVYIWRSLQKSAGHFLDSELSEEHIFIITF